MIDVAIDARWQLKCKVAIDARWQLMQGHHPWVLPTIANVDG